MSNIKRKLGLLDVKQALLDTRFQDLFPELKADIQSALKNPACACNRPIYEKFFQFRDRLEKYFPNRVVETAPAEITQLAQNNWTVINCHIKELEGKLRRLAPGRKQLAVARYQDDVTVIVNELDIVF